MWILSTESSVGHPFASVLSTPYHVQGCVFANYNTRLSFKKQIGINQLALNYCTLYVKHTTRSPNVPHSCLIVSQINGLYFFTVTGRSSPESQAKLFHIPCYAVVSDGAARD